MKFLSTKDFPRCVSITSEERGQPEAREQGLCTFSNIISSVMKPGNPEMSLSWSFPSRLPGACVSKLLKVAEEFITQLINKYLLGHLLFAKPHLLGGDIQGHELWLLSSGSFLGR